MTDQSPVFIVGMARSGTTLMRAFLSAHPDIAVSPETHFLSYWVRRHGHEELRGWSDYRDFWAAFSASHHFTRMGVDAADVSARLPADEPPTFRSVFTALMDAYAAATGKPRWGEKTPGHHAHLARVLDWYPNAQVVYMLRDPRAVVASLLEAPWAEPSITHQAARWRDSTRSLNAWDEDPRVQIVHYEALVTDPETTLRRVCDFLGEPFDDGMMARGGASREESSGYGQWGQTHIREAHAPLRTDSLLKWQRRLTAQQVALIEYLTRKGMFRYGYTAVTEGPGAFGWARLMGARVHDRLSREVRRVRGNTRSDVADVPPGAQAQVPGDVNTQASARREESSQ